VIPSARESYGFRLSFFTRGSERGQRGRDDTHKSFIGCQGGRDEGEQDGGDETPLHGGRNRREGEIEIRPVIRTFPFIRVLGLIDVRGSEGTAHAMTFDRQEVF
jgi:hypothetical protein